jgi:hypothetical protein
MELRGYTWVLDRERPAEALLDGAFGYGDRVAAAHE